jgi:hypothetical protein
VLGGGGSPAPLAELGVQVAALGLLAAWVLLSPDGLPRAGRLAWGLAGLLFVLPAVQLVPLPPILWQSLPGRELEQQALALIGAENAWKPWSLAPSRTLAGLLAVVPPAIVLVMTASLNRSGRTMAIGMVAGVALLSLVVGAGQMSGGEGNSLRFYVPEPSYLAGFQANHNSTADVLLIGMVALAAVVREWSDRRRRPPSTELRLAVVAAGTAILGVGVILTASRAGTLLLPVASLGVLMIVRPWLTFSRKTWVIASVAVPLVLAFALAALLASPTAERLLERYTFAGEFRPQLWRDSMFAAQQYFPFGGGVGAFVPVFLAVERLEVVDPSVPNRAHNDILELLVEGGVLGVALLLLGIFVLARLALASRHRLPAGSAAQIWFAVATFAIVALHSQVDYPLRSMSLACIAALAAGLLVPKVEAPRAFLPLPERMTKEPI